MDHYSHLKINQHNTQHIKHETFMFLLLYVYVLVTDRYHLFETDFL